MLETCKCKGRRTLWCCLFLAASEAEISRSWTSSQRVACCNRGWLDAPEMFDSFTVFSLESAWICRSFFSPFYSVATMCFWHPFWHILWHSIILSDILSGVHSDILFDMLSGIYSDILSDFSGILSDICSDILSRSLSGIYSDIISGILSGIYSDILSGMLSGILSISICNMYIYRYIIHYTYMKSPLKLSYRATGTQPCYMSFLLPWYYIY